MKGKVFYNNDGRQEGTYNELLKTEIIKLPNGTFQNTSSGDQKTTYLRLNIDDKNAYNTVNLTESRYYYVKDFKVRLKSYPIVIELNNKVYPLSYPHNVFTKYTDSSSSVIYNISVVIQTPVYPLALIFIWDYNDKFYDLFVSVSGNPGGTNTLYGEMLKFYYL